MDSALAQLKLEALLGEIRVDYGALEPAVDAAVRAVEDVVAKIPEKKIPSSLAGGFLKDLGVPEEKSSVEFRKPESLTLIGSYSTRTMARPGNVVDLAMRIPKACFYEKDYLNHRYHAKRALYLAYVAKFLSNCDLIKSTEWAFLHNDARKPLLLLRTGTFVLRLIPSISNNVFDVAKLDNARNNVHDKDNQATPSYNGSILEDMFVEHISAVEKKLLDQSGKLQEALMLMKVWLRQRSAYDQPDSLNGFLLSIMMLHLASAAGNRRLSNNMTPLQIFRVTLETIAKHDLFGKGFRLDLQGLERRPAMMVNESCVLFSDTYGTNLLFRMSKSSLNELTLFAERSLESMRSDSGFQEAFLTTVDFAAYYDYHISFKVDDAVVVEFLNDASWRENESKAEIVLNSALKDRVSLRVLRRSISSSWNPKKGLSEIVPSNIQVGAILSDFDNGFRMVDVGPKADDKTESAKFRKFWGKKSELRRFKDGTIAEAVAWECKPWQRHLIIPRICKYIISRHFSIPDDSIQTVSDQLDFALFDKNEDSVANVPKVLKALEEFSKRIKSLTLPLKVSSVQPISASFRHAAVYTPRPNSTMGGVLGAFLEPLDVMIQLEGSGRWPSDAIAIQKTKAAFCLKIADSMRKEWNLESVVSEDAVDILIKGFAFRMHLFYEKDPTLLKQNGITNLNAIDPRKDLILQSVHSSTLNGLHGRYPAYGPTVRLAKRWIGAHLFSGIISDEAVELIAGYVFTQPQPMFSPSTRITGFIRFLRLVATFEWELFPLIVDINGDMSSKDRDAITAFFEDSRKGKHSDLYDGSKGPAMFIATQYDKHSLASTRTLPSRPALKRLVAYAKSSAALSTNNISGIDSRWQSLFRTPLRCYDVVVVLQTNSLPHPSRVLFAPELGNSQPAVVAKDVGSHLVFRLNQVMVGFNPVLEYVKDLKGTFGEEFDVWYDALGSNVVGLTLKSKPKVGSKRKLVDMKATSDDLVRLGKGLVQSLYWHSKI